MNFRERAIHAARELEAAEETARLTARAAKLAEIELEGVRMRERFAAQFSAPVEAIEIVVCSDQYQEAKHAAIVVPETGLLLTESVREPSAWLSVAPPIPGRDYHCIDREDAYKTMADFGKLFLLREKFGTDDIPF